MSDTRTLRQKLEAMADQVVSPHEAAIAAEKLEAMGEDPPPPTRPTAVGGFMDPEPSWTWAWSTTGNVVTWAARVQRMVEGLD